MAAHNWEKYFDVNSEYWTKLQKLYEINDNYPKKKVRGRELHHKFLRCFSRVEGAPIDNDKENLVSLSCGDHFLAHYYIWKCTNKGYRRYTCRPVILMYKKSFKYITDETAERIAADWSDVLKCNGYNNKGKPSPMKGKPHSEEWNRKIGEGGKGKHKGKHWFTNGIINISAKECPEGFHAGRTVSDETRRKQALARTGKEPWNKDKKMTKEYCEKMSESHKKQKPWNKGKPCSEETKKKISATLKKK